VRNWLRSRVTSPGLRTEDNHFEPTDLAQSGSEPRRWVYEIGQQRGSLLASSACTPFGRMRKPEMSISAMNPDITLGLRTEQEEFQRLKKNKRNHRDPPISAKHNHNCQTHHCLRSSRVKTLTVVQPQPLFFFFFFFFPASPLPEKETKQNVCPCLS